jgi:hypothetical protein
VLGAHYLRVIARQGGFADDRLRGGIKTERSLEYLSAFIHVTSEALLHITDCVLNTLAFNIL